MTVTVRCCETADYNQASTIIQKKSVNLRNLETGAGIFHVELSPEGVRAFRGQIACGDCPLNDVSCG